MSKNRIISLFPAVLLILGIGGFFSPKIMMAAEDNSAPQVTAFEIAPSEINTESDDQTLTLSVTLTDNLAGVAIGSDCGSVCDSSLTQLSMKPASGGSQMVHFTNMSRTSGTALNGTYTATATVPRGAANGTWEVYSFFLIDKVGNYTTLYKADIESSFGEGSAEVSNTASSGDTVAPQVTAFEIAPSEINTESSDQTLTLSVTLTDDMAGVCTASDCGSYYIGSETQLTLKPASGGTQSVSFTRFTRATGDDLNGTYTATATMPKGYANGIWEVYNFLLVDKLGNYTTLYKTNIESSFGEGSAEINNTASSGDTTAPQVTAFSITPSEINTESSSQTLTLSVTLTDNMAGVAINGDCGSNCSSSNSQMRMQPLIGTQTIDFYNFTRTSGNDQNGTYTATATMPVNAKEGIWEVYYFYLVDKLGNGTSLYKTDIESAFGSVATIANTAESTSVRIDREWTVSSSQVSATFPEGTVVTKNDGGSFAFYKMVSQDFNIEDVTTDGLDSDDIGNIVQKIKIGVPGLNLSFSNPVTLEFNVGSDYEGQTLEIDTLEENGSSWANETTCTVSNGKCSFTVDHASYFAAVKTTASSTTTGTVTGSQSGTIVIGTDTPTLNYSTSKKAKKKISLIFNSLTLTKKKWVKIRLNGRKVTVQRVRRNGNDSIVRIYVKYRKWTRGNYSFMMTFKNKVRVPYTTKKGKTKYRNSWESGAVTADNILSII